MSAFETIKAAYAAFGRNDPSVPFGAMDSAINWNQAESNPVADRNRYVGANRWQPTASRANLLSARHAAGIRPCPISK